MANLGELTRAATRAEVEAVIYESLQRVGTKTSGWKPGGVVRTLIAVMAAVVAAVSVLASRIASMMFLDEAEGDWLDVKGERDYGIPRSKATQATGEITLINTGGGSWSLAVGDLIVSNPSSGATYRNTVPITLGPLATVTGIAIESTETGAWTSAAAGEISELVSSLPGVSVTNPGPVLGRDKETDPEYRARCRLVSASGSPGAPPDALRLAALSVTREDGTAIGITRARTIPTGDGTISLIVATATGTLAEADRARVEYVIKTTVTTLCVVPVVTAAERLTVAVALAVYVDSSGSVAGIEDAVGLAVAAFFAAAPIGGWVVGGGNGAIYRSALGAAVARAVPGCFRVDVLQPSSDLEVGNSAIPVLGSLSVSVSMEAQR